MKHWYKLLLPVLLLIGMAQVQAQRTCGSADYLQQQISEDPARAQRLQQIEQFTSQYIANNPSPTRSVVNIPVVVHVVYNTTAQNVSDAMILAQIDRLNKDYRALNSDVSNTPSLFAGNVADCQVTFCLAQRDPSGNATTGIRRVSTTKTSFSTNDNVKHTSTGGDDAWDRNSYLNLWVCNLGSSLLGYAQFPGGAAATDGVVILYSSLPGGSAAPYNLGRTATHEVGHWLNLYHIWGDDGSACTGTDNCADTPNQGSENYGCPTFPHPSCSNTSDMFMNYMDYTDDGCMYMFTNGQASRMAALFAAGGSRSSILNSQGCVPVGTSCGTPTSLSASSITSSSATVSWSSVSGATSYNLQYQANGGSWTTVNTTSTSYGLSGLAASTTYNFQVQAVCTNTGSYSSAASFTTTSGTVTCNTPGSLSSSNVTTSTATVSWGSVSGALSYNLQYQVSGASSWTTVNTSSTSYNLTGLNSATTYNFQVQTVCSATSTSAYSAASSFLTASQSTGCTDNYEANNSQSAAKVIPAGTAINALIYPSGDIDWFKFTTTTSAKKIKATLTNLPFDYDLYLYKSNGSLITYSNNGGTTDETVKYNTNSTGTWYVRVIGYNGANSSSQCYALTVSLSATNWKEAGDIDVAADHVFAGDIDVYPNPTTGKVAVDYLSNGNQDIELYVIDMLGRTVALQPEHVFDGPNTLYMDMNQLSNGMYLVMVKDANGENSKRVMLQR